MLPQHNHNHEIKVADALRFKLMSEETKAQYYDLFKQGHFPSSARLEYVTNLMYTHNPQVLVDLFIIFFEVEKNNFGVRT